MIDRFPIGASDICLSSSAFLSFLPAMAKMVVIVAMMPMMIIVGMIVSIVVSVVMMVAIVRIISSMIQINYCIALLRTRFVIKVEYFPLSIAITW